MANPKQMLVEFYNEYRSILANYQGRNIVAEVARQQLKDLNKKAQDSGIPFVADMGAIDQEIGIRAFDDYDSTEEESSSSEEAYYDDDASSD